jgi:hypothetical protein
MRFLGWTASALLALNVAAGCRADEPVDDGQRLKYHEAMAKQRAAVNTNLPSYDGDFLSKNGLEIGDGWRLFVRGRGYVVLVHAAKAYHIHVAQDPHFYTKSAANALDRAEPHYGDFRSSKEVLVLNRNLKVFFVAVPDDSGAQNAGNAFGWIEQLYIDNGFDLFHVFGVYANGGQAKATVLPDRIGTLAKLHGSTHSFSLRPVDWLYFNDEHVVDWDGRIPLPTSGFTNVARRRSAVASDFQPDRYDFFEVPVGDPDVARALRVTPDDLRQVELRRQLRIAKSLLKDDASGAEIATRLAECERQFAATIASLKTRLEATPALATNR